MDKQLLLRQQLIGYLTGNHAHAGFKDATKDFPANLINRKLPKVPYSFWQLLEHMRLTQNDILDFIRNRDYKYKLWPKDYWPPAEQKADLKMWTASIKRYQKDFADLKNIIKRPATDLLAKIPHGEGQTVVREIMLVIDHNAYHLGELIILRRALGAWKK